VTVAKIATGEVQDTIKTPSGKTKSGRAGAAARTAALTAEERSDIARKAAEARWE
jgi:hypothetical protein